MAALIAAGGTGLLALWKRYKATLLRLATRNQFIQAGLVTPMLYAVSRFVEHWSSVAYYKVEEAMGVSLMIKSEEKELWDAITKYLDSRGLMRSKILEAKKRNQKLSYEEQCRAEDEMSDAAIELEFVTDTSSGYSVNTIQWKGRSVKVERSHVGDRLAAGRDRTPMQSEVLKLSCLGSDDDLLKSLVKSAVEAAATDKGSRLNVYTLASYWPFGWVKSLCKAARPLDTVVLDDRLAATLVHDARRFLEAKEW